ncbi:MAG TPA: ligase-associated DNA damage response endonuclease PdeM [Bacteroidia bacterium]|nr:ligase-associated DNA damage response endonuclease PdeM [Bacteroidia bacterium]
MEIEIREHRFKLLPQKAIYWKNKKTLLISDLHLGKVTHFRKSGIALPSIALINNFRRLDELILTINAERIILLGDLFHSSYNEEWELFSEWRKKYHSIQIITVLGNHDILPMDLFKACEISVEDYLQEEHFLFIHHPVKFHDEEIYSFCGHIHPVHCLKSRTKQRIKLPCFVVDEEQTILPSFGVFTGGYEMKSEPGRKIFVVTDEEVFKV